MTNKSELISELRKIDEITLLELLEINADDLVDAFLDQIDENQSKLIKYLHDTQT